MTTTRRFGLTREGLTPKDADLIDTVLLSYEAHLHVGGVRLVDPVLLPTAVLSATGSLPAGVTYFYREAWVDQFGLETAAGQEVSVTTPSPVAVPDAPLLAAVTGGTLAPGPTYYALSAVVGATQTSLSSPTLISLTNFNTVQVSPAVSVLPTGVTSFNVWRQGPQDAGFTNIGAITNPAVPFVDNGSVLSNPNSSDPKNLPPSVNLTNATSAVTLTTSNPAFVGAATGGLVKAWRLYRSTQSGVYSTNCLLAEINTTVNADGTGGLLTSFVDSGLVPPGAGSPQNLSQTLTPTVLIKSGVGGAHVENPLLLSPTGQRVGLVDVHNGVISTVQPGDFPYAAFGTPYPMGSGPCFLGTGEVLRLVLNEAGGLSLVSTTVDAARDQVYAAGAGPRLVASGGSKYDLTIDAAGHLLLTNVI